MKPEAFDLPADSLRDRIAELETRTKLDSDELRLKTALLDGAERMLRAGTSEVAFEALRDAIGDLVGSSHVMITGHSVDRSYDRSAEHEEILFCDFGCTGAQLDPVLSDWLKKRRLVRDVEPIGALAQIRDRGLGVRSLVSVPFGTEPQDSGVIVCMHRDPGHFSPDHQATIRRLAVHFANALRSIRLSRRTQVLAGVVEGSTAGLMVISPEEQGGEILYVNRAMEALAGLESADLVNMTFLSDRPADSLDRERLRAAFRAGEPGRFVVKNPGPLGKPFDNEINLDRIEDPEGNLLYMLATMADVSELVAAEERQRGLERKLRDFQKNESIGRLAAGVAHDFNNLLAVISGSAELLSGMEGEDPLVGSSARRISVAASRAAKMINRFLDLGRVDDERSTLDLGNIISESRDLIESTMSPEVQLCMDLGMESLPVYCNAADILRISLNLCQNAQDALEGRPGEIVQSLRSHPGHAAPSTEIRAGQLDPEIEYACYRVQDSGCGMSQETISRLFREVVSTKGARGSGVGMLSVAELVQQHGGAVGVHSEVGKGTAVEIYLPTDSALAPVSSQKDVGTVRLSGELILLVDDDPDVSAVVSTYLERIGAEVAVCDSPEIALEMIEEDPDAFSVLLTDYSMPGMSGSKLAQKVHALSPRLPIFVITALARKITDAKLDAPYITRVLPKPIDLTKLGRLITEHSIVAPKA